MRYFRVISWALLGLGACQQRSEKVATPNLVPRLVTPPLPKKPLASAIQVPIQLSQEVSKPIRPVPTARFIDTLRTRPLVVERYSAAVLQQLGGEREYSPDKRYVIVLKNYLELEGDEEAVRLFYRLSPTATSWWEIKSAASLLGDLNYISSVRAKSVYLHKQLPADLVYVASENAGGDYTTATGRTLLLRVKGSPQLLWQSIDYASETAKPASQNEVGEMIGGNFAEATRTLTVQQGVIHIGKVRQEGEFGVAEGLTPIPPGDYRYQGHHFHRVRRTLRKITSIKAGILDSTKIITPQ